MMHWFKRDREHKFFFSYLADSEGKGLSFANAVVGLSISQMNAAAVQTVTESLRTQYHHDSVVILNWIKL